MTPCGTDSPSKIPLSSASHGPASSRCAGQMSRYTKSRVTKVITHSQIRCEELACRRKRASPIERLLPRRYPTGRLCLGFLLNVSKPPQQSADLVPTGEG